MTPVADLLARLDLLGVTIRAEGGNLMVGTLPPVQGTDLLAEIRQHKAEIVAALQIEDEYLRDERLAIQAEAGGR